VRDLLVRLRLKARPPLQAAQVCRAAPCTIDADCNDGDLCNGIETCVGRTCAPGTPVVCDDGNACNGNEACDPRTGACLVGRTLDCDDANPCTDEVCNPSVGCVRTNNTGPCDDDDLCTGGDVCSGGACHGTPVVQCDDGNACNGTETCDPESAECVAGVPPSCADGNPCTDDGCVPSAGCVHTNNVLPCNDHSVCTENDVCQNGTCTGTPRIQCDDGNACNGKETCNPTTGLCVAGAAPDCDDDNPCTDDSCTGAGGCVHAPRTGACDDGNVCTIGDSCQTGVCVGSPDNPCDDGDPCNGVEACNAATGQCDDGPRLRCDDRDPCTIDTCDPNGDGADGFCRHEPNTDRRGCGTKREAIDQRLGKVESLLQQTSVDKFGGTRSQRQLARLVTAARRALQSTAPDLPSFRKAAKRVRRLATMVGKWSKRGKIDPTVAGKVSKSASELLQLLEGSGAGK
jgi:hypothetical protein